MNWQPISTAPKDRRILVVGGTITFPSAWDNGHTTSLDDAMIVNWNWRGFFVVENTETQESVGDQCRPLWWMDVPPAPPAPPAAAGEEAVT